MSVPPFDPANPETERRAHPHLEELITHAVQAAIEHARVIDAEKHVKHHEYIDTVLEREAKRSARWDAIIEKSLAGLVWSGLVALGAAVWNYLRDHLK